MPKPVVLIALAVLGMIASSTAQPSKQGKAPTTQPSPSQNVSCDRRNESSCLRLLPDDVIRDGDHLRIKLANGKDKIYTTAREACDAGTFEKCLQYSIVGAYSRPRLFLVDVGFIEGGTMLLVSGRTGEEKELDAVPQVSPSGRRLVAVSASEAHGKNSIEILVTTDDLPRQEWRYEVPDDEYSLYQFVSWDGDNRIKMTVTTRIGGELHQDLPVEAVRTDKGWRLMPPIAN